MSMKRKVKFNVPCHTNIIYDNRILFIPSVTLSSFSHHPPVRPHRMLVPLPLLFKAIEFLQRPFLTESDEREIVETAAQLVGRHSDDEAEEYESGE